MTPKLHLTDLRSTWSKADHNRPCDSASVSTMHNRNPFGLRPVQVLVHTAIGYTVWQGNVPQQGTFNRAVYDRAKAEDWPVVDANNTDPTPDTKLYLIDPGHPPAAVGFAHLMAEWFKWSTGWHVDFFSNYLAGTGNYYAWNAGLALAVQSYRLRRAELGVHETIVIGQEWHRTPPDLVLDGWYWEQYPWKFLPTSDWEAVHARDVAGLKDDRLALGYEREPFIVAELAGRDNPPRPASDSFSAELIADVKAWCADRSYRLSLGRDAQAGVGA